MIVGTNWTIVNQMPSQSSTRGALCDSHQLVLIKDDTFSELGPVNFGLWHAAIYSNTTITMTNTIKLHKEKGESHIKLIYFKFELLLTKAKTKITPWKFILWWGFEWLYIYIHTWNRVARLSRRHKGRLWSALVTRSPRCSAPWDNDWRHSPNILCVVLHMVSLMSINGNI